MVVLLLVLPLAMKVGGGESGCVSLSVYCFSTDKTYYKQQQQKKEKIKGDESGVLREPSLFVVVGVVVGVVAAVVMRH